MCSPEAITATGLAPCEDVYYETPLGLASVDILSEEMQVCI